MIFVVAFVLYLLILMIAKASRNRGRDEPSWLIGYIYLGFCGWLIIAVIWNGIEKALS